MFLIEWHAERYIERPPTELVRQRARTAGYCENVETLWATMRVLTPWQVVRRFMFEARLVIYIESKKSAPPRPAASWVAQEAALDAQEQTVRRGGVRV